MKASVAQNGPVRTCISCREAGRKEDLLRLVGKGASVSADPLMGMQGRGRYVHVTEACMKAGGRRLYGNMTLQEFQREVLLLLDKQLEEDMNSARRFGWMTDSEDERIVNRTTRRIHTFQTWTKHLASTASSGC